MDKRTKKEIQSKHGAKKTPKPKYNLWQNTGFMLRTSRKYAKSVFPLCIVLALLSAGKSVAELLIAPAILNKIELSASFGSVVFTIAAFALVLMLLSGLRSYVDTNALFGRIAVRSQGIYLSISRKYAKTSYPNLLNTDFLALGEKASAACAGNSESSEAIWTTLTDLMTSCIGFIVYLALLTNLNLWLAALVAATTAVSYFASKRINEWGYLHRSEELELTKKIEYANKTATSREFAKDIRMFGLRGWLEDLWGSTMRLYSAFCAKRERKYIWANIIDIVLTFLRNGIAYAFLIGITVKNGLPASQFLLYFAALSGFAQWVVEILDKLSVMHKQSLDISTIREFLDWDEPFDLNGGERIAFEPNKQYEIRLDNVSFRYPTADKDTLSHINLTVHPGEKLAIVGLNGAGKTTLVKLVCGFLDPTEGRILLNGEDIRKFNRNDYYALFSAVFQEFSVLDVTVKENVAQCVDGIDETRVWQCIDKAGLTEKIKSLPKGIETHLGRRVFKDGVEFSGGQTQRLMLARALYKNAPILVLDEPTAALDPIAENDIYQKYNDMTHGRTSFFISHRLASTRFCDRIIFVDSGKIAEEGTHDELLKNGGGYAYLFEVQSKYYRSDNQDGTSDGSPDAAIK
ncbi:MAG: ABC transporter ATP-binding protein [Clostridium sp.]|nr:ABC transporter ATP-binding protein [Clostridium sp.]